MAEEKVEPPVPRRERPRRRISSARLRGLLRLVILVALVGWLVVLDARGLSSGSKTHTASTAEAPP